MLKCRKTPNSRRRIITNARRAPSATSGIASLATRSHPLTAPLLCAPPLVPEDSEQPASHYH